MRSVVHGFLDELDKLANAAGGGYFGSAGLGSAGGSVPSLAKGSVSGYKDGGVITKEQIARLGEDGEEVVLPKKKMRGKKDRRVYNYVKDKVR